MFSSCLYRSAVEPLPPSIPELLADPQRVRARYPINTQKTWRRSRARPRWPLGFATNALQRDTPAASFYRIYEFLVIGWVTAYRNELEYFCRGHPDWAVADLPDPGADSDHLQRAALAALTQVMCEAFNRRVELGLPRDAPAIIEDFDEVQARPKVYERAPEWAFQVEALPETFHLPDLSEPLPIGDRSTYDGLSQEFMKLNVHVLMPHVHFV